MITYLPGGPDPCRGHDQRFPARQPRHAEPGGQVPYSPRHLCHHHGHPGDPPPPQHHPTHRLCSLRYCEWLYRAGHPASTGNHKKHFTISSTQPVTCRVVIKEHIYRVSDPSCHPKISLCARIQKKNRVLNWPPSEMTKSRTCHPKKMAESPTVMTLGMESSGPPPSASVVIYEQPPY